MREIPLKYELYIKATPEQVWDAMFVPENTRKLFFGCVLESTFEIGSRYAYIGPGADGDETVHVYGEVLAYEPYKTYSSTEHAGPSYRENHAEFQSRITFNLETVGNCTKFTLINDEWTEGHPSYDNTQSSWSMILSNLKTYCETGETIDFGW
ncbi:SRPBCC family protein [Paenibacillus terrigena]|uniref:SRPBCC family protein n=1 Tax=Paenibacillus terrigena TaxID=369333 RepID=UPI00035D6F83|nr:SRPBCC family protein [Paenibacillus terrigena]